MTVQNKKGLQVREMTYIGIFTAMIIITGYIQIPLPFTPVPITLQTMAVMLAGLLLSRKEAGLSMLVYVLLGAIGLPVFAGGKGGLDVIVGPTGGYLISWIFAAWSIAAFKGSKMNLLRFGIVSLLGGIVLVYLIGVPWLAFSTGMDMGKAIAVGAVPFLLGDLFKWVLALMVASATYKHIQPKSL